MSYLITLIMFSNKYCKHSDVFRTKNLWILFSALPIITFFWKPLSFRLWKSAFPTKITQSGRRFRRTCLLKYLPISIQINHQPDAIISPVFYLMFIYSSTCFGRPHVHHQEFNNCSSSLWFLPSERGDSSAVGCGRAGTGRPGPTTTNSTAITTIRR